MSPQLCLVLLATFIFNNDSSLATASLAPLIDLTHVDSDFIQFKWNVQRLLEQNVDKIKVTIQSDSHSGIYGYATADVSAGGVTIDELEPHTLYDVTVQATGEGVNIVYPIGSIKTRSEATRKSMFEATYTEDIEILDILIHEPEGDEEDFDGYEVLRKTGGLDSQHAWQSVANLTADEREYEMEGVEPLTKYAVKVRGLVLPDSFIEMDDPLVFETMDADVSVPRDVKLQRFHESNFTTTTTRYGKTDV
ncbi:hypothetical protein TcWFU_005591 [Taenia crassiceps]|uniref:Fibronectin type-III domain-containing protein n=1 Tax=Taenia crassiceps TaxID=6207 RepID=A0ABR4Q8C3_9CEST